MIYGISGTALPAHLPFAPNIQRACETPAGNFPPCLAYPVAWRETIRGCKNPVTVVSSDGGHGLYQLTSSFPIDWDDVDANIRYALEYFLKPSLVFFADRGLRGDGLIRCVAAAFNEGQGTAWLNHLAGNVDLGTTGHNYASDVLSNYHRLISGQDPI